jgi:hypothetical protein
MKRETNKGVRKVSLQWYHSFENYMSEQIKRSIVRWNCVFVVVWGSLCINNAENEDDNDDET